MVRSLDAEPVFAFFVAFAFFSREECSMFSESMLSDATKGIYRPESWALGR